MFLWRSAFWLILAFILIRPDGGPEISPATLSATAAEAGRQIVLQTLVDPDCPSLGCTGARVALSALTTPAAAPVAAPITPVPPLPRPRPAGLGI